MTSKRAILVLLFLVGINLSLAAADGQQLSRIKELIVERRCYELYFQGGVVEEEAGTSRPLKVAFDDHRFYARIDPAGFSGPSHQPWQLNYIGEIDGNRIRLLIKNSEPDLDEKFASSSVIQDTLTMPANCEFHYDPDTREKQRMLDKVVQAVQATLASAAPTESGSRYPAHVKLTVANFNVDYPYAYVLVEEPQLLFSVALHDPNDSDEAAYQAGDYWVGQQYGKQKLARITPNIRVHGITRTIVLHDAAGKPAAPESTSEPPAGAARSDTRASLIVAAPAT